MVPGVEPKFAVLPPRKSPTLVILKVLGEGNDLKSEAILSRVQNHEQAIRDCAISYECVGFGCGDLHIIEGTSTRKDYERDIIDISTFVVDDYEVFQVKKKI
ncbi:unnamed protein product [Rhizophagus irregularis]|nr:unnamed protein product [Rhizophagus irregularis]